MAVAAYEPFVLINQLQNEVNRLFATRVAKRRGEANADWVPPVDIREEADQYVITADLPGVDTKEIEVTMEKGVLSLRGKRAPEPAVEDKAVTRRERPAGSFHRSFVMPESADAEGITALGKNGVLQVLIPKRQKPRARRIQVEG
jgi:HSP20 family protein